MESRYNEKKNLFSWLSLQRGATVCGDVTVLEYSPVVYVDVCRDGTWAHLQPRCYHHPNPCFWNIHSPPCSHTHHRTHLLCCALCRLKRCSTGPHRQSPPRHISDRYRAVEYWLSISKSKSRTVPGVPLSSSRFNLDYMSIFSRKLGWERLTTSHSRQ